MKGLFKNLLLTILLALIILPNEAWGGGYLYFSFSPATGTTVNVASVNTPYQIIYPQNDFISGFDLWLDNPGAPGTAAFYFLDSNNNILASQTATIPTIQPIWSGTAFHVDFPSAIAVSSTAMYKLKIVSSLPNLDFYYGNKIQLLEHNSAFPPPESVLGSALLGTAPQNFYFKIALYENGDTIPPIISNVSSSLISNSSLGISFNTNEPSDFKIVFTSLKDGTSQIKNWGGIYQFCNQGIATCNAAFAVNPGTTYNYQITAVDYAGNASQANGSVSIPSNPTAPVSSQSASTTPNNSLTISNINMVSMSAASVTIAWQTSQAANATLLVSLDSSGTNIVASISDTTVEFYHTLTISGNLKSQTNYFAALISTAPGGYTANQVVSFTTPIQTQPVQTINQTIPNVPNPNQNSSNQTIPNSINSNLSPNTAGSLNTSGQIPAVVKQSTINPSLLPEPTVTVSTQSSAGESIITVYWQTPAGGEPNSGYQIDVLDANNQLAKRITAPAGVHKAEIRGLPPGNYHLLLYSNQDGILVKIARELFVKVPSRSIPFYQTTNFYVVIIILIILGAIVAFYAVKLRAV